MCEPQINARRAENASTSAPVLLGTRHQPAQPQQPAAGTTSHQSPARKHQEGTRQLGLVRPAKKNTLVNER
jgi:hypothetical protein